MSGRSVTATMAETGLMNARADANAGSATDEAHAAAFAALVARAQKSDRAAFSLIYQARAGAVGRYAATILHSIDRAEDITAQTFLVAWKNLPTLREPQRFDAWLFRIAHNAAIDELQRRPTVPLEGIADPADSSRFNSPSAALEGGAEADRLRAALLRLPAEQRAVLVLRFFGDLPHADVSRQLGKSEEAVRALQYRALRGLRKLLQTKELGRD